MLVSACRKIVSATSAVLLWVFVCVAYVFMRASLSPLLFDLLPPPPPLSSSFSPFLLHLLLLFLPFLLLLLPVFS